MSSCFVTPRFSTEPPFLILLSISINVSKSKSPNSRAMIALSTLESKSVWKITLSISRSAVVKSLCLAIVTSQTFFATSNCVIAAAGVIYPLALVPANSYSGERITSTLRLSTYQEPFGLPVRLEYAAS